jgi:hypothetical protein
MEAGMGGISAGMEVDGEINGRHGRRGEYNV